LLCAAVVLTSTAPSLAQDPTQGFAPDLQIAGGVGLGLDDKIDNNFLGRLRIGALHASEPYWISGGLALEVGALAGLAIGAEIEANEIQGWFTNLGLTYARNERLTGHVSLGYMIFALEYQHGFADRSPSEALLFSVRFPLGFWWFTSGREERPFAPPPSTRPNEPVAQGTVQPTTPAAASGDSAHQPRPLGPTTPDPNQSRQTQVAPVADPQTRERVERGQHALDEASLAGLRGDYAAQSDALRRAYAARADPLLFLRIADAEIARGKRALAAEALQSFLASTTTADASVLAEKPQAQAKLNELMPQLARVRLSLEQAKGDEQVAIDGAPQPSALLGYDVWVDPGPHVLTVRSAPTTHMSRDEPTLLLLERAFEARAGELVRLSSPLPAATPAPER
jgi:hypothetical protein